MPSKAYDPDRNSAITQGLLSAGLGILAQSQTPYGASAIPGIAEGLSYGLQSYNQTLKDIKKRRAAQLLIEEAERNAITSKGFLAAVSGGDEEAIKRAGVAAYPKEFFKSLYAPDKQERLYDVIGPTGQPVKLPASKAVGMEPFVKPPSMIMTPYQEASLGMQRASSVRADAASQRAALAAERAAENAERQYRLDFEKHSRPPPVDPVQRRQEDKQRRAFDSFSQALDTLDKGIGEHGLTVLPGKEKGKLGTQYSIVQANLRELFNTGVLQPGELPFFERSLNNPTDLTTLLKSGGAEGVRAQINELKGYLNTKRAQLGNRAPSPQDWAPNVKPGAYERNLPPEAQDEMPPPNELSGKVIEDDVTGKRYRSDGVRWSPL